MESCITSSSFASELPLQHNLTSEFNEVDDDDDPVISAISGFDAIVDSVLQQDFPEDFGSALQHESDFDFFELQLHPFFGDATLNGGAGEVFEKIDLRLTIVRRFSTEPAGTFKKIQLCPLVSGVILLVQKSSWRHIYPQGKKKYKSRYVCPHSFLSWPHLCA